MRSGKKCLIESVELRKSVGISLLDLGKKSVYVRPRAEGVNALNIDNKKKNK